MQLTDDQKQKVAAWIADGLKLSDIQSRLADEFDVRGTYMDVRLLVDDLKLMPRDPEPEPKKEAEPEVVSPLAADAEPPAGEGKVTLTTDTLAKPGTIVSGIVTFSDGNKATWYLDQTGRLGVVPEVQGYRPPSADVQEFQMLLDREMAKMGY
jgi:hypothetical protein